MAPKSSDFEWFSLDHFINKEYNVLNKRTVQANLPFEIRKHPDFGSPLYSDDHCVLHRICKKGISQLFANLRRAFYEASQQREPKF